MAVETSVSRYLSVVGRTGGKKSRRQLSSDQARDMVRVRELRRAFREYYARCFWYMRPDADLTLDDLPEVVRGLRKNGRSNAISAASAARGPRPADPALSRPSRYRSATISD